MPDPAARLLDVRDLVTGYGKKQVLNGVSLCVGASEIVALIGHNGAGKSTALKTIFGLLPVWNGRVSLDGEPLNSHTPRQMLRSGVAYVPQGNRVFTGLTVRENLEIARIILPNKTSLTEGLERALAAFPQLRERLRQRAGTLSGGEKQILALANALVFSPRLLLLDEPSLGLAPPLVSAALARIQRISQECGAAVLIVEQKVREVLRIAHRVYFLRNGVVSYSGPVTELRADEAKLREAYL